MMLALATVGGVGTAEASGATSSVLVVNRIDFCRRVVAVQDPGGERWVVYESEAGSVDGFAKDVNNVNGLSVDLEPSLSLRASRLFSPINAQEDTTPTTIRNHFKQLSSTSAHALSHPHQQLRVSQPMQF